MTELPPLTEFQGAIVWAIGRSKNNLMSTWEIAQVAFPDKWKRRQGRGALVGHVRRACFKMPDFVGRLDPKTEHDDARYFLRNQAISRW